MKFFILALAIFVSACDIDDIVDNYDEFDARIEGHNPTNHTVDMIVSTERRVTIPPQSSVTVEVRVKVREKKTGGSWRGEEGEVTINFFNLQMGLLTEPRACRVEQGYITVAKYDFDEDDEHGGDVDCDHLR